MSRDRLNRPGVIDSGREGECGELANAGNCHQPAAYIGDPGHLLHVGVDCRHSRKHGGSGCDEAFHRCGQAVDPLAGPPRLIDEGRAERAGQSDAEHHGETTDLVLQQDALTDQLLTRDDQRANGMRRERLHVHGLEESGAGKVRQTTGIVAIGLVGRKGLQRLVRLPAFDADDRQTEGCQPMVEHRRHPTGLEHDARQAGAFASEAAIASGVDAVFSP